MDKACSRSRTDGFILRPHLADTFICLVSEIPEQKLGFPKHRSRSHDAVIRVYDNAGNVIETIRTQSWLLAGLPLENSVKTSRVETLAYSGYEHSHNYGVIATTSQLLSSSIECVVR